MKNKLYIAYGSNLNLPQMAGRCPTAKVVGASEIKDYALVFRGGRHGAVATIEPCEGSSVPVLLWKITPKDEAALDIYEGFPPAGRQDCFSHGLRYDAGASPGLPLRLLLQYHP